MSDFMKYRTLTAQTTATIHERISSGVWMGTLPREKEISRILGVSRNTVRGAIASLVAEGWIIPGGKGFQHTINPEKVSEKIRKKKFRAPLQIVRFLNDRPFYEMGGLSGTLYTALLEHLRPEGFRLVFELQAGLTQRFNPVKLARLAAEDNTAGWILHRQTKEVQQWFANSGIPTLVTGSVFPGIELPSVRFDYASSSRHAVHEFLRRGHRRIAFVTPATRIASEDDSIEGFLKVKSERPDIELSLIEHDDTSISISRGVLSSRLGSSPVTAYYVMNTRNTFSVLISLIQAGVRIPQDAAIICRAGDLLIKASVTPISHYDHDANAMGRAGARMFARVIQKSIPLSETKDILPTFVPGKSV